MLLLISSSANVSVVPGVLFGAPKGYVVSNLDPTFNSTSNNEIYDPNFLPGFEAGLTNISVYWNTGSGYANLGYSIGPWAHEQAGGIPHFAVGPQCCNFREVSHTQQFRRVEWGDYYYVKAGLGPPGVNVENYTAVFGGPTSYVGLKTDWDWTVQFSLNWKPPVLMNPTNERGAIGIATTQYVPSAPGNLVYTLINFWMDTNSSNNITPFADGTGRGVAPPNVVVYHPVQIMGEGNQTITLNLSPYLQDTLRVLGFQSVQSQPPVISYVYLNVEGYNFEWNTTLWSFKLMSPTNSSASVIPYVTATGALVVAVAAILLYRVLRRKISPVSRGEQLVKQ